MPDDMIIGPPTSLYDPQMWYRREIVPTLVKKSLRREWDTLPLASQSADLKKTGDTRAHTKELNRLTRRTGVIEQDEAKLESEIVKAVKAKDKAKTEELRKQRQALVDERKGIVERLNSLREEIKHGKKVGDVRDQLDALNSVNHASIASLKWLDYTSAGMVMDISAQADRLSKDIEESASVFASAGAGIGLVPGLTGGFRGLGASRN